MLIDYILKKIQTQNSLFAVELRNVCKRYEYTGYLLCNKLTQSNIESYLNIYLN